MNKKEIQWKFNFVKKILNQEVVDLTPNEEGVHIFGRRKVEAKGKK